MKALWKQVNTLPRKGWLTLVLLALTAVLYSEFSLALSGWNDVTWGGSLPLFLLNLLPVLLVLLVLWLATGQAWLAVLATGVLHFLLTGGNSSSGTAPWSGPTSTASGRASAWPASTTSPSPR